MAASGDQARPRYPIWGLKARTAPGVTFEEYSFWAKIEREMEEKEHVQLLATTRKLSFFDSIRVYLKLSPRTLEGGRPVPSEIPLDSHGSDNNKNTAAAVNTTVEGQAVQEDSIIPIYDYNAEWRRAARALRTANWMTTFYLITTDVLGWSQTPYAFASAGYAITASAFIIFGLAAGASGFMIWRVFMMLDSSRYPVLNFGDAFFRLFGPRTRTLINILQAFQILCSVAVILISNSQKLSQLAHARVCYIVIVIINVVIAMTSCTLRALKQLGWLCNCAVWINIVTFIIIMTAAATHGPDTTIVHQITLIKDTAPVKTFSGIPPSGYQQQTTNTFAAVFNAIDTIAYAYSGTLLFIGFMAEMRHPMDFWKAIVISQVFIVLVYFLFGIFVYHYMGQYSILSITQVISPHAIQILCNISGIIMGFLSTFLYFNIGMKTIYLEVGQEIFRLPPITEKKGYFLWLALGPVYWIFAMILAVSIPNFAGLTNLIGGLLLLNFTYTIPPVIYLMYVIKKHSALPGEGFDPQTGITTRHDNGWRRHVRGVKKSWYISIPLISLACAGLACSGLGTWSAIESLIPIFGRGGTIQTAWGCTAVG
ncbi:hypothetical protein AYL99_04232 [Fonsecaea erecta]|uniref:Amino acid transporter transmembrane domain-containing protein n=1 Tax=Fonsecaea erecta TaxID=1367422 RepID=A0A178ZQC8_9EURO|nr:hypothetical protein AYL99_04232 [Fonsecaea erecta]OAP62029.1 hypothetical protein AYL99_04232 [Fonsecaea erecta]